MRVVYITDYQISIRQTKETRALLIKSKYRKAIGVDKLNHLIVARFGYLSMCDEGLI